jgi:hypothetical protein
MSLKLAPLGMTTGGRRWRKEVENKVSGTCQEPFLGIRSGTGSFGEWDDRNERQMGD